MSAAGRRRKPLAPTVAPERRALFERLVDPAGMLELLQRELPRLAPVPVRVLGCRTKQRRRRVALRAQRLEVVYALRVGLPDGTEREYVLLGTAPEPAAPDEARGALGHPALAPFTRAILHVPELELGLRFFPFDPALPALAELTGPRGAERVAPHLPECRAGLALARLDCELRQYKPFKRAVLRLVAGLADGRARALYVKAFADRRGERTWAELRPLFLATRSARALRLPEPLGYDAERRLLFLSEASGERVLTEWLKCLEKGRPLPDGVDAARLERCMTVAARAAAELARCGVRPRLERTFQDELARLRRDLAGLGARVPEPLLGAAARLVERLADLAPARAELVPVHGCFRHKQMVGDEHALTLIDWDGLCLGLPGLDAATFLARLERNLASERGAGSGALLAGLARTFRSEFLALGGASPAQLARCEALVRTQELLRAFRRPGEAEASLAAQAAALSDRLAEAGAAVHAIEDSRDPPARRSDPT